MARTPVRIGHGEGGGSLPKLAPLLNDIAADLAQMFARVPRLLLLTAQEAASASTTGVHAAITDTGEPQVVTTEFTAPPYPRNITATAGGTAGHIKAIQVIVEGTNVDGEVITETLPAFTVDTPGTVVGSKAFATVTKLTLPAHDGTSATTALGFGDKLGLPESLPTNTVLFANHNNVRETTAPTVTAHASNVESNTVDLDTVLNGSAVAIAYIGGVEPTDRLHLAAGE